MNNDETVNKLVAESIAEVLNEAYDVDPKAIKALMGIRVSVNKAMEDHPLFVVRGPDKAPVMGTLGLINGIMLKLTGCRIGARLEGGGDGPKFVVLPYDPTCEKMHDDEKRTVVQGC